MSDEGVKLLLGYNIAPGVTREQYERWLQDVHIPDLQSNPFLDRVVFNTVRETIDRSTSAGTPLDVTLRSLYRVSELEFSDYSAYAHYVQWFRENPVDALRGPEGRTDFQFCVLCDSADATH